MQFMQNWPYVNSRSLTGDYETDATGLLIANGKPKIAEHCVSVMKASGEIAARFQLDPQRVKTAALLHDISAVLKPMDMLEYAKEHGWIIDEAEERYPFLLHQRMSAVIAREGFGVRDPIILSAIECHTTLKDNPSDYDMAVFRADKLAWDQEGTPPYAAAVNTALKRSLCEASLRYIEYVLDNGMILFPHSWLIEAKKWLSKQE